MILECPRLQENRGECKKIFLGVEVNGDTLTTLKYIIDLLLI